MTFTVLYGHLNKIYVSRGQELSFGEAIGELGNTGFSTGPHVHIGVVEGKKNQPWYRGDFQHGSAVPHKAETLSFEHPELFTYKGKVKKPYITHGFDEMRSSGKHFALDLVTDRSYLWELPDVHFTKAEGIVTFVHDDSSETSYGYGKMVGVTYTIEEKNSDSEIYVVKSGDSLGKIAESHGTTYPELVQLNKNTYPSLEKNPDFIAVGWKLKLPQGEHLIKAEKRVKGNTENLVATLKNLGFKVTVNKV